MSLVLIDLETGGTGPEHPDIQLAAVALDDLGREVDYFEAKIQFDETKAEREALELNCYDPAVWAEEARPEAHVVRSFGAFLRPYADIQRLSKAGRPYSIARIGGHNAARFDAPRLLAMFGRYKAFLAADAYRPLDTLQLALWESYYRKVQLDDYKLETVARWLNVPADGAHDALQDVRMTVGIYRALILDARPRGAF